MKKNSLIIGGHRGIGLVIHNTLKKRGDNIFSISRSKINNKNFISADISTPKGLNKVIKNFKNKKINNLIFSQRYRGLNPHEEFQVMVEATNNIIKIFNKNFFKNSSIVVLSSIATLTTLGDQNATYHYTRGALDNLVKYYACTLGKNKIRINCIQATKIFKPENKSYFSKKNNIERKLMEKITPLRRMGDSQDVADLVDFLTSDKSTFITGTIIPVDGGLRLVSQEQIAKMFIK
jgi:NAD(P)-dependent dehydrogenase (short-subunit alcohol dehydrogenase family)